MLALSTTDTLAIIDPVTLKNLPSIIPSGQPFPEPPTTSVWSQSNSALFVAFSNSIHEYSPLGVAVSEIFSSTDELTSLVAKDKGQALIFGASTKVHVLEYGSGVGKVVQTFASHKSPINSLSLSNDSTLLASASSSAAHVYNLSLGSHTVLRGLPQSAGAITTCEFHPHSRTRLLLGMGNQVLVYDTTRPSGPIKAVTMSDASSGDIVALACSPFSKTLVAVATCGGSVGLIDLDKEKGLFRTLNLKMPLTSASFSPEGAALYFGTENGKLLIVDLRVLDKPPKCVSVGQGGHRIECINFQKKVKATTDTKAKLMVSASVKPTTATINSTRRTPANNVALSPSRTRSKTTTVTAGPPTHPIPRKGSTTATAVNATRGAAQCKAAGPTGGEKKVFSPVRDPLGNSPGGSDISVRIETLGSLTKKNTKNKDNILDDKEQQRPLSRLSTTRVSRSSSLLEVPEARPGSTVSRAEVTRSTRKAGVVPSSTSGRRSASRAGSSISCGASPELPTPTSISAFSKRSNSREDRGCTRSPELPTTIADPVTPVPLKKRAGLGVLGLGTPEVERWIEAGKGNARDDETKSRGRKVGFKELSEDDEASEDGVESDDGDDDVQPDLSMQISPRRAPSSWAQAPIPSPLRTLSSSSPPSSSAAHNLLRTIIADVMYDYQRETKAEMTGLHLDLVRMGRGLRRELREVKEGGAGGLLELERLKEENRLLREENERLRRGY